MAEIQVVDDEAIGIRERRPVGRGIVYGDVKSHQAAEPGEHFGDAAVSDDQQFGFGQDRLDIDVHDASAGHAHSQHFIGHIQGNDLGPAAGDAFQGLVPYGTLGAASADPTADQLSFGVDDRLRARLGGRRSLDPNYGGESEGLAGRSQLRIRLEKIRRHRRVDRHGRTLLRGAERARTSGQGRQPILFIQPSYSHGSSGTTFESTWNLR